VIAVSPVDVAGLPGGQGWRQAGELGLALALSACVGVEREMRQKSARLRTHALVGLCAALFMLVSKYGFSDVAVKASSSPTRPGWPPRSPLATGQAERGPGTRNARPMVGVSLHVHGRYPVTEPAAALSQIDDVDAILIGVPGPAGGSQGLAAGMRNMA
jgi:hypothetical protein